MKTTKFFLLVILTGLVIVLALRIKPAPQGGMIMYTIDPGVQTIQFYWKDEEGKVFNTIQNLKTELETKGEKLIFATNGGMYQADKTPVGLYIQNGVEVNPINTNTGEGNFYLEPNGIFYITKNHQAFIRKTSEFIPSDEIAFATQSGPMLIMDGELNPIFNKDSTSTYIRNGVCIGADDHVTFVMSKKEMNFYDFATYFKKIGCINALYLDGFVSRTYLPEKNWEQLDGDLGVMIGVTD